MKRKRHKRDRETAIVYLDACTQEVRDAMKRKRYRRDKRLPVAPHDPIKIKWRTAREAPIWASCDVEGCTITEPHEHKR